MAAGKGHTEVVKALLEAGAGKDIADKVSRWLAAPTIWGSRAGGGNGSNGDRRMGSGRVIMVTIGSLPGGRDSAGVYGCGGMYVCCLAGWVWRGPPGVVAMLGGGHLGRSVGGCSAELRGEPSHV